VNRHYLDHASTSPPRPEVLAAMRSWLDGPWADPGRLYDEARSVRSAIEEAREQVAELLGVRPRQCIFTSGGTEAIHAAVWGATRERPGRAVLCAAVEHSAVRESSARLAPVENLPVDAWGRIEPDGVAEALESQRTGGGAGVALVHCQWANHEIGTIQPVTEIAGISRQAGVPLHVDAAAAFGHVEAGFDDLGADMVSVSAHKIGGPPGIGVLAVRRGLRLEPLLVGGQQERSRRAGMENVPAIIGFGAAAAALSSTGGAALTDEISATARMSARLLDAALSVPGISLTGDPTPGGRLPHLVCLSVEGVEAEPVLLGLDRAGISAHSGSACSSESFEPSPVLRAIGADAGRSLRLSTGWSTTDRDVDAFAAAFGPVLAQLRSLRTG